MLEPNRPTLNGTPIKVQELNTGSDPVTDNSASGLFARLSRFYKNLSLFMAGMYTGVGCSGTPHAHHHSKDSDQTDKPGNSGPV